MLSVIISTHNPNPGRLRRTLRALRDQDLPATAWETLIVDNASTPAWTKASWNEDAPSNLIKHRRTQAWTYFSATTQRSGSTRHVAGVGRR
ncbi:MAG: glycosyltransferase [Candidatus Synoicihabitans palmerolidicus]|nr:glycosyltransferase [Candidatus Synoicihabitans palmerolidicus]